MSHDDFITRSIYLFFCKGKKSNKSKSSKQTMYIWKYLKQYQKTTITSNNRFLLMLGEFKTDQLFVEKTKLANNLYVENLNHLS